MSQRKEDSFHTVLPVGSNKPGAGWGGVGRLNWICGEYFGCNRLYMQWEKESTEIPDFFSIVQPRVNYFNGKIPKQLQISLMILNQIIFYILKSLNIMYSFWSWSELKHSTFLKCTVLAETKRNPKPQNLNWSVAEWLNNALNVCSVLYWLF